MAKGKNLVLVVDVDGTLLHSDMVSKSFWSTIGRDWRGPAAGHRLSVIYLLYDIAQGACRLQTNNVSLRS